MKKEEKTAADELIKVNQLPIGKRIKKGGLNFKKV